MMSYDAWKTATPDDCEARDDGEPSEPEPYCLAPKGTFVGGSRRAYLDGVKRDTVVRAFGKPDLDAYYEPKCGYDGDEWAFVASDGVTFNVYARWGAFRIGSNASDEAVEDFAAWLREKLGLPAVVRVS